MAKYRVCDYAKRVGVTRQYIEKLEKKGKIDYILKDKKKYVESDQVDKVVKYKPAHRAISKVDQNNGKKNIKKNDSQVAENNALPSLDGFADHDDLDKIKLYEQVRKLRIENDAKEKTLVEMKKVDDQYFEIARAVRDSLESIPGRVSGLCVNKTKHEIEQALTEEIKRSLLNLVDKI